MSHEHVLSRPIVVVGAPRSGTTILSSLLGAHPSLSLISEPRLTWKYGNESKSDALRPEDASPRVKNHIRSKFKQFSIEAGGGRIVEKTPANSLRMGFTEAVLDDCQFVHIVRNGLDSVLSINGYWKKRARGLQTDNMATRLKELKLNRLPFYAREILRRASPAWLSRVVGEPIWGVEFPGIQTCLKELDLLDVCCLQWRTCVEAACQYGRKLPSDRYLECRLEDLTPELLRKILEFCNVEDPEPVIGSYESRFKGNLAGAQTSAAKQSEIDYISERIEPTMRWLGY